MLFVKTLALNDRFNGATTEEEIFSYLWNRNEIQHLLNLISHMDNQCKTKEASEKARNNGNVFYKSKLMKMALLNYNISILTAPHPPILTNDKTKDVSTGDSKMEPYPTATFTDTKVASVSERTRIDLDNNSGNGHDNYKGIGIESPHEIIKLQQAVLALQNEVSLLREQVAIMSEEIANLQKKVATNEDQEHCTARELENEGVDNTEYRELALGYANRSAVLYELQQYEECIRDINLALKYGYPKSSREKLMKRRTKCEAAIKTGPYERLLSSRCSCQEVPLTNTQILGASEAIDLAFTPAKGRHLVAKTDIRPGEILMDHKTLVAMPFSKQILRCSTCKIRCYVPLPCPSCSMAFCSEVCRTQGLAGEHQNECIFSFEEDESFCLVRELMMKTTFVKLKDLVPKLRTEKETQHPSRLGFNENGVYDPSDYRTFYHLLTNKDNRKIDSLFSDCILAVMLLKLLLLSEKFFTNEAGIPFTPSSEDLIFTGGILFHHFLNINANNATIMELETTSGSSLFAAEKSGSLFSPLVALMNHSCYPSAMVTTCGNRAIVIATRSIKTGEEVTLSYLGDRAYTQPETTRRQKVLCNFYFLCHCVACEGKWSELIHVSSKRTFKCLACGGPVSLRLKTCMDCGLDFLKSSGENVYDLDEIGNKISQGTQILMTRLLHYPAHKLSKIDLKSLISVIEIFDKYVYPPDEVHEAAQRMLVEWFTITSRHYIRMEGF
ncbi:SET and MYND domain-containing protein 4-like [Penaeus indicus]|uniref:SET and MYND domain-containing protein 4-like n=1 Tax=Penaeus indicus TaxID=29960 RepID=UPI00300C65D4